MFLFVNVDEAVGIHISIPHIRGMVIYWHIFLIIAVSILMTIANNKTWTIDLVGKLLLLKCLTDLISFFFNINTAPEGYLGYYACSVTAFFSYVVFIQKPCMEKEYYKYYLLFGIILAIQTIQTFFMVDVDYFDVWYKTKVNIPYGATNIIASGIVPILVLPFFMDIKKFVKIAIFALLMLGIVLTKSRGGSLLAFFAVAYAALFTNFFRKNKKVKRLLFLMIGIVIIIVAFLLFYDTIKIFLSGYSGDNLNSLSSGRLGIFLSDLKLFTERPLFGHGLGPGGTIVSGTHNLLIDLLYKCGIVGFTIYCMALICIYVYTKKNHSFFRYFIFIMFLNSLFEVCYFSYKCDTIFWCAAGLAMNGRPYMANNLYVRSKPEFF